VTADSVAGPAPRRRRVPLNPVLRRELVQRWRGRRAVLTLTVALMVLGLVQYLMYRVATGLISFQFGMGAIDEALAGPLLGRFLLDGLLFFVLLLVLFVGPGYAAAQLSGERERRTLPLLQVTLLRPHQVVLGKLGASTAWLALLVVAALPLGAASFLLGGVSWADLVRGVAFIVAVGVCVAGMALGVSSLTRRTTGSVVITYALVLALTGGTLFLAGVEFVLRSQSQVELRTPRAFYLNPFFGLADAARADQAAGGPFFQLPSPLGAFSLALPGRFGESRAVMVDMAPVDGFGPPPPFAEADDRAASRPATWAWVLGWYGLLGSLGVGVAALRLRTGRRRGAGP
jgi:ABC-2 type transport system permease protein